MVSRDARSDAYHTGYEANRQGEARTACPYGAGTWEADQWRNGWDQAYSDRPSIARTAPNGTLRDYETGANVRPATAAEQEASRRAAESDGGAGVITVDGRACYVED